MIGFLKELFFGLNDSNSVKTNIGRVPDSGFKDLVNDGCVSMIDGKTIVDTTLYKDRYWGAMKKSCDPENRKYYEQNYERSRAYREDWLQTENGIAWRKRHGHLPHSLQGSANE